MDRKQEQDPKSLPDALAGTTADAPEEPVPRRAWWLRWIPEPPDLPAPPADEAAASHSRPVSTNQPGATIVEVLGRFVSWFVLALVGVVFLILYWLSSDGWFRPYDPTSGPVEPDHRILVAAAIAFAVSILPLVYPGSPKLLRWLGFGYAALVILLLARVWGGVWNDDSVPPRPTNDSAAIVAALGDDLCAAFWWRPVAQDEAFPNQDDAITRLSAWGWQGEWFGVFLYPGEDEGLHDDREVYVTYYVLRDPHAATAALDYLADADSAPRYIEWREDPPLGERSRAYIDTIGRSGTVAATVYTVRENVVIRVTVSDQWRDPLPDTIDITKRIMAAGCEDDFRRFSLPPLEGALGGTATPVHDVADLGQTATPAPASPDGSLAGCPQSDSWDVAPINRLVGTADASGVVVFAGPGSACAVVDHLAPGQQVPVLSTPVENEGVLWVLIDLGSGQEVWVPQAELTLVIEPL